MKKISKNHNFNFRNFRHKVAVTLKKYMQTVLLYLELLRQNENVKKTVNSNYIQLYVIKRD